jgi:hypothetical protein
MPPESAGVVQKTTLIKDIVRNSENEQVMSEKKKSKLKGWISFRVKPEEYDQIHALFSSSACRKLSEYARKVLLHKPVYIKYRNQSADDFLREMLQLKSELNAIGNNFNQAVKKLHTLDYDYEIKKWTTDNELIKAKFLQHTDQILIRLHQIHSQWSSA